MTMRIIGMDVSTDAKKCFFSVAVLDVEEWALESIYRGAEEPKILGEIIKWNSTNDNV